MKCRVCGEVKRGTCICGYCLECIKKYGHIKCGDLAKENEDRKLTEREKEKKK